MLTGYIRDILHYIHAFGNIKSLLELTRSVKRLRNEYFQLSQQNCQVTTYQKLLSLWWVEYNPREKKFFSDIEFQSQDQFYDQY